MPLVFCYRIETRLNRAERCSGGLAVKDVVVLAKVYSCAVVGLDGVLVEVEVDVGQGMPGVVVVGLPDAAVQESKGGSAPRSATVAADFLTARSRSIFAGRLE